MKTIKIKYDLFPDNQTFYDLKNKSDKVTLIYSTLQESWTHKGKKAHSLKDTGDGFLYKDHHTKKEVRLDYDQSQAISLMLDLLGETIKYDVLERERQ